MSLWFADQLRQGNVPATVIAGIEAALLPIALDHVRGLAALERAA
jgi:hypothetical protein